ncbi:hypothetical protein Deipr_1076 [Deinococcus proteolyticus MRP]|uniref:DUF402 domain-containing protein n=2 Tax=Deinococcus TaxID=1298 RepID=F0RN86_DEIPM|nr:DUF402 domain-containing protein [Deinococcus proteolyticus]ADY26228.1 hypothetical protein Deipr_1076 [Deinococcus proteolyticus MRP]
MRRKLHDLREWTGALDYSQRPVPFGPFLMVDFTAYRVRRPLTVDFDGEPLRLFDHGWRWIRAHPLDAPAGVVGDALTVLLDASGTPLELYVDIHQGGGWDEMAGLPWIDDLYLDVAGLFGPGWQPRHLLLLDGDELAGAVAGGELTAAQSAAIYARAEQVMAALNAHTYAPLLAVRAYLQSGAALG